jgi:hypothetical protein
MRHPLCGWLHSILPRNGRTTFQKTLLTSLQCDWPLREASFRLLWKASLIVMAAGARRNCRYHSGPAVKSPSAPLTRWGWRSDPPASVGSHIPWSSEAVPAPTNVKVALGFAIGPNSPIFAACCLGLSSACPPWAKPCLPGRRGCHSACNIDALSRGIGVQNWL